MIEMTDKNTSAEPKPAGQQVLSPEAEARLAAAKALREQRLAKALRENLKRRKAQVRGRTTPEM